MKRKQEAENEKNEKVLDNWIVIMDVFLLPEKAFFQSVISGFGRESAFTNKEYSATLLGFNYSLFYFVSIISHDLILFDRESRLLWLNCEQTHKQKWDQENI